MTKLEKLGPIALVMSEILKGGQMESSRIDKIPKGIDDDFDIDDLGYFTKSFLIFKGTPMKSTWISNWKSGVGVGDGIDEQGRPIPRVFNFAGV